MGLNLNTIVGSGDGNEDGMPRQENIEPGSYPARIVEIIDMGVQVTTGKYAKPPRQKLKITYELVDEFCKDAEGNEMEDKPRWIDEKFPLYSLSIDKATSTKRYNALDPSNKFKGDITQLLGEPCTVTVINKPGEGKNASKVYDNVASAVAVRKKEAANIPPLVNKTKLFLMDEPDLEVYESLTKWMREDIMAAVGFDDSPLAALLNGEGGDEKGQEELPKDEPASEEEGDDDEW